MPKRSIHSGPPLEQAIEAVRAGQGGEGSVSGRLNAVADRYLHIVEDAMPAFTLAEWSAICDANNGTFLLDLGTATMLWANVHDSPELDEKWGVQHDALAAHMSRLPLAGRLAVAEVVERFWKHSDLPTEVALQKAGARFA